MNSRGDVQCKLAPAFHCRLEHRRRRGQKQVRASVNLRRIGWVWCLGWLCLEAAFGQHPNGYPRLADDYFKNGTVILRAFVPSARFAHESVVKLNVGGTVVALGTIIDSSGLILTKASEVKRGPLTATLANGARVRARVVAVDEENDVSLVKVSAAGLKPVRWAQGEVLAGQWAITPGTDIVPEAVGVISAPPRKILHRQAFIGVQLDFRAPNARIAEIIPGLGAEKAGLAPGDVILAVNDAAVKKSEDLAHILRTYHEGQDVKLRAQREARQFDVTIEMAQAKPEGGGRWADRQEKMNHLGTELSDRAEGFALAIQHDTVLQPWQCGGPLINVDGKAIGLNIARAGRIASYALPAVLVAQIVEDLKSRPPSTVKRDLPKTAAH